MNSEIAEIITLLIVFLTKNEKKKKCVPLKVFDKQSTDHSDQVYKTIEEKLGQPSFVSEKGCVWKKGDVKISLFNERVIKNRIRISFSMNCIESADILNKCYYFDETNKRISFKGDTWEDIVKHLSPILEMSVPKE